MPHRPQGIIGVPHLKTGVFAMVALASLPARRMVPHLAPDGPSQSGLRRGGRLIWRAGGRDCAGRAVGRDGSRRGDAALADDGRVLFIPAEGQSEGIESSHDRRHLHPQP